MAIENHCSILVINLDEDKLTFAFQIDDKIKYYKQISIGAKKFDNAVIELFKKEFSLLIGERTARTVWTELVNLSPQDTQPKIRVRGRNVDNNELENVFVTSQQISEAVAGIIKVITNE